MLNRSELQVTRVWRVAAMCVALLVACVSAPKFAVAVESSPQMEVSLRLAVLDFQDRTSGAVSGDEILYLSDLVRGAMRRNLAAERYVIMTRENILELLPDGRTLAECIGDCAVQTGRNIAADHVVSGEVTSFAGEIRVTVNLHETAGGNLLGQVRAGAPTLLGVERDLELKTLGLLLPLQGVMPGGGVMDARTGTSAAASSTWKASGAAKVVVNFSSEPTGALVEIDGQPVGDTPCRRALSPGLYRVGFMKARHFAYEVAIEVIAGSSPSVSAKLEPDFGWITVESEPPGLSVVIDGQNVGQTPLGKWEASTGPHTVSVTAETHHPEVRDVTVDRGRATMVQVSPVGRTGGLLLIATDSDGNAVDAPILADGKEIGRTFVPTTLLRGRRLLSIEDVSGYWNGEVLIEEEQVTEQAVELEATPVVTVGDMRLIRVPAGRFTMGSPKGQAGRESDEIRHEVVISRPFMMSVTEVTQAQYELLVHENPSRYRRADVPVDNVTWYEAAQYCNFLSDFAGLPHAYVTNSGTMSWNRESPGFRLPTSAEWEYACRAGTETSFSCGDTEDQLQSVAWFKHNSNGGPHAAGSKLPNVLGLHDMHGNVWEWCWDWYSEAKSSAEEKRDPLGPDRGEQRVWRGGSWEDGARYCRSANVGGVEPASSWRNLGFRVVRTIID